MSWGVASKLAVLLKWNYKGSPDEDFLGCGLQLTCQYELGP